MCNCNKPIAASPVRNYEYETLLSEILAGEYEDEMQKEQCRVAVSERTFFSDVIIGFKRPEIVKGKRKPDRNETAVFWSCNFDPSKPVDIIFFFHGLLTGTPGPGSTIRNYLETDKKKMALRLREEVDASGKNVMLIVPYLGDKVQNQLLTDCTHFAKYREELLGDISTKVLRAKFSVNKMKRGRLILAGHSAGGKVLLALSKKYSFDEIWGFDSIYGGSDGDGWTCIASNNPKSKIVFYYISDGHPSKTRTFNTLIAALEIDKSRTAPRLANLKVIDVKKDPVRRKIMGDHFSVIRPALKECLQGLTSIPSSATEWENEYEEYEQPSTFNVKRAISKNKTEARKLKWRYNRETIESIIGLPAGSTDADFALAVAKWQAANLPGKPDGIVGAGTWRALKKQFGNNGFIRKGKNHGWKIFGGVPIRKTLCRLVREGKLTASNTEIEMLRLVSENETGGYTSAVNSWDDSFMTMGFTQHTIKSGQLQDLIDTVPEVFKKYGIEIDGVYEGSRTRRIKGTTRREDLHDIKWAHIFYKAGLDDQIIVAETKLALKKLSALRNETDPGSYLQQFNGLYPNLWAYIYECNNAMPVPFARGLRKAITIASGKKITDPVALADVIRTETAKAVRTFFTDNPPKTGTVDGKVNKMDNIYTKMKAGSKTIIDNAAYCN